MKVLLVNTYGHAGAANSCIRLHLGLRKIGIESYLLFLKDTSSSSVAHKSECAAKFQAEPSKWWNFNKKPTGVSPVEKRKILTAVPEKLEWFSFADNGYDITTHEFYQVADIVNLHWVSGFVDYATLAKIKKPVVWTLHDMNPFTGGCHYSNECELFTQECQSCPQLKGIADEETTGIDFQYKSYYLNKLNDLSIVAPSVWLTEQSRRSTLFASRRHETIPYGIDGSLFRQGDRAALREKYRLPHDKKIILFVAYKSLFIKRKGYVELKAALQNIVSRDILLLAVGGDGSDSNSENNFVDFGFVEGEGQMAELYSLADLFVIPSLEDNLPNTVIESLLCGTPVVGFKTGGIPDMVKHKVNGIIAEQRTSESLGGAIDEAVRLIGIFDRDMISTDAREKFSVEAQANAYSFLFRTALKGE